MLGVRNYQIIDKSDRSDGKDTHLIEIGPRMVLIPIRIFSGTFAGATLYQNMAFVSPNQERSNLRKMKGCVVFLLRSLSHSLTLFVVTITTNVCRITYDARYS